MKRFLKVTITLLFLFFTAFSSTAAQKAMGTVEMKDGRVYSDVQVEIPGGTEEILKIKADGKKIKLNSDEVSRLILWNEHSPEKRYLMKYSSRREIDYDKGIDQIEKYNKWFVLLYEGEYVDVWVYACMIDVGKNGISTGPCDTKYGYNTFYNYWKKGDDYPVFMKYNRKTEKMEEWCAHFFSEDKVLSEKILNKEYRAATYKDSRRFGTMLCPMLIEKITADFLPGREP